jgi:hypothetical protein
MILLWKPWARGREALNPAVHKGANYGGNRGNGTPWIINAARIARSLLARTDQLPLAIASLLPHPSIPIRRPEPRVRR